jgi:hypothetical protein
MNIISPISIQLLVNTSCTVLPYGVDVSKSRMVPLVKERLIVSCKYKLKLAIHIY